MLLSPINRFRAQLASPLTKIKISNKLGVELFHLDEIDEMFNKYFGENQAKVVKA